MITWQRCPSTLLQIRKRERHMLRENVAWEIVQMRQKWRKRKRNHTYHDKQCVCVREREISFAFWGWWFFDRHQDGVGQHRPLMTPYHKLEREDKLWPITREQVSECLWNFLYLPILPLSVCLMLSSSLSIPLSHSPSGTSLSLCSAQKETFLSAETQFIYFFHCTAVMSMMGNLWQLCKLTHPIRWFLTKNKIILITASPFADLGSKVRLKWVVVMLWIVKLSPCLKCRKSPVTVMFTMVFEVKATPCKRVHSKCFRLGINITLSVNILVDPRGGHHEKKNQPM